MNEKGLTKGERKKKLWRSQRRVLLFWNANFHCRLKFSWKTVNYKVFFFFVGSSVQINSKHISQKKFRFDRHFPFAFDCRILSFFPHNRFRKNTLQGTEGRILCAYLRNSKAKASKRYWRDMSFLDHSFDWGRKSNLIKWKWRLFDGIFFYEGWRRGGKLYIQAIFHLLFAMQWVNSKIYKNCGYQFNQIFQWFLSCLLPFPIYLHFVASTTKFVCLYVSIRIQLLSNKF